MFIKVKVLSTNRDLTKQDTEWDFISSILDFKKPKVESINKTYLGINSDVICYYAKSLYFADGGEIPCVEIVLTNGTKLYADIDCYNRLGEVLGCRSI